MIASLSQNTCNGEIRYLHIVKYSHFSKEMLVLGVASLGLHVLTDAEWSNRTESIILFYENSSDPATA